MREKDIEQRLVGTVKAASSVALNLPRPSCAWGPDHIVFLLCRRRYFMEVKTPDT